ncbi:DegT/DnrJ/EryC1/StrS family aminotransferase [Pontimonas sp.]|nr:DegT/DnrJ/EryC1/StrS family aminotransferase [Pontimonas sp.]
MSPKFDLGPGFSPYLAEIEKSGIYSNFGPQVKAFTREISELLGEDEDRVVTASNATAAIIGSLANFESSDWLLPSWTFSASVHGAVGASKKVTFGDVDLSTNVLVPSALRSGECALVTAPFGAQLEVGEEWNGAENLVVDAAAAIGAPPKINRGFRGRWATVYSLQATKLLGIGEGAVVVFSDPELAKKFKTWTNFGFTGTRVSVTAGTNAKMSELHAAVGRYRLAQWATERDSWLRAREIVDRISTDLSINVAYSDPDWVSPYWIVQFDSPSRKTRVADALRTAEIESRDWWSAGCHPMPAFKGIQSVGNLTNTDYLASTTLGLPFFRDLGRSAAEKIAEIISTTE